MVAIVQQDAIRKPAHPEQREWLVMWLMANGDVIFADSLSDIVSVLIPGYEDLDDLADDDLQLHARVDVLAHLAGQAQVMVLTDMAQRGIRLTPEELAAATADKRMPAGITRWNPADPLILLTTSYEPFSDEARPEGAISWLDPSQEAAFLSALNKLGQGELYVTGG